MESKNLFWSKKGDIACAEHAPVRSSSDWHEQGWQEVPPVAGRRIRYQCQYCATRSIHHQSRLEGRPPLILNVDDRPSSLYARDRILRRHGFTVANADSGSSALDVARQLQPNLILLDVHLPDIDGRQLCLHVKADTQLRHIPIVLISSTLGGVTPDETLRNGHAEGFIAEPVEPDVLADTLRRVLQGAA